MLPRPEKLGLEFTVASEEDADALLHEMAWLTGKQALIEGEAQAKIEAIKKDAQSRMVLDIDGETVSFKDRYNALWDALHAWCVKSLKAVLPANKRSLKLSHGELKLRALPTAVQFSKGAKPADVARNVAREAGLLAKVDELLAIELDGVPVAKLLAVEFVVAKDAIKAEVEKNPGFVAVLKKWSISIESDTEQITIAPAAIQVATVN